MKSEHERAITEKNEVQLKFHEFTLNPLFLNGKISRR